MNEKLSDIGFIKKIFIAFEEKSKARLLKKGEFLLKEGLVENNLYLIEKGAVKIYYLSEYGEKIIRLGYNGSIINSLSSFLNGRPSELYIEAIRQTKVKIISRAVVQNIIDSSHDYSNFLETILVQQLERELDLLEDSPARRLERVLQRSPDLFQHVPLKYIAAYLRMNPETLSRIRKP